MILLLWGKYIILIQNIDEIILRHGLKHYWDKSRNNLKIDQNERVYVNTL